VNTENLSGRRVLVTGAGSGIGRATALECARRGADLIICDVDEAGLAETEREARATLSRRVDVADREQMRAFADEVGAVDLLVNNAGIGVAGDFVDTPLEEWDRVVGINLIGVVHGCHFFVPKMIERGAGGHVVNVSSMAGYQMSPGLSAYCATKFAVLGLSETLREELHQHGIGVTAICPGIINTPITRSTAGHGRAADPELRERLVKLYERRNYGPDRVARNILKAVQRGRVVAPVSPEAWFSYGLKRTSPRLMGWIARKTNQFGE